MTKHVQKFWSHTLWIVVLASYLNVKFKSWDKPFRHACTCEIIITNTLWRKTFGSNEQAYKSQINLPLRGSTKIWRILLSVTMKKAKSSLIFNFMNPFATIRLKAKGSGRQKDMTFIWHVLQTPPPQRWHGKKHCQMALLCRGERKERRESVCQCKWLFLFLFFFFFFLFWSIPWKWACHLCYGTKMPWQTTCGFKVDVTV